MSEEFGKGLPACTDELTNGLPWNLSVRNQHACYVLQATAVIDDSQNRKRVIVLRRIRFVGCEIELKNVEQCPSTMCTKWRKEYTKWSTTSCISTVPHSERCITKWVLQKVKSSRFKIPEANFRPFFCKKRKLKFQKQTLYLSFVWNESNN